MRGTRTTSRNTQTACSYARTTNSSCHNHTTATRFELPTPTFMQTPLNRHRTKQRRQTNANNPPNARTCQLRPRRCQQTWCQPGQPIRHRRRWPSRRCGWFCRTKRAQASTYGPTNDKPYKQNAPFTLHRRQCQLRADYSSTPVDDKTPNTQGPIKNANNSQTTNTHKTPRQHTKYDHNPRNAVPNPPTRQDAQDDDGGGDGSGGDDDDNACSFNDVKPGASATRTRRQWLHPEPARLRSESAASSLQTLRDC